MRFRPTCPLELPSPGPRVREQAEAGRLDGARGQHEDVRAGGLVVAVAVDVFGRADDPPLVEQAGDARVEAELALFGEQRAPQRRHRRRALRVVWAAEAAAEPAVDARRA